MLRRRSGSRKELTVKQILSKFFDFLDSSIWALPVATFIEQKSTVFDRAYGEQAHDEYHKCFREFNGLVSTLLDCFCADADIDPPKFREAVTTISQQRLDRHQRANLEPVAASTDFEVFVPMMMRKNLELQLQALQMIEYLCGVIPQVLLLHDGETLRDRQTLSAEDTERYVLISVMRQSKEEFDDEGTAMLKELAFFSQQGDDEKRRLNEQAVKEAQLVQQAMNEKPLNIKTTHELLTEGKPPMPPDEPRKAIAAPVQSVPVEKHEKTETRPPPSRRASSSHRSQAPTAAEPITKKADSSTDKPPPDPRATSARRKSSIGRTPAAEAKSRTPLNDVRRPSLPSKPPTASGKRTEHRPESPGMEHGPRRRNINDALLTDPNRPGTADVEARRKYLQQQRDKLLEMKQTEREKQLQEVSTRVAQERPRTAKAARGAMRGGQTDLEARKQLMEKLKTEIIQ